MFKAATRIVPACLFLACWVVRCSAAGTWEILSGAGGGRVITASWFADERSGWLATDDGSLLVSHDGGDSWRNTHTVPAISGDVVSDLQLAKREDGFFYGWAVTRGGRALYTPDGESWKVQKSFGHYLSSVQALGERSAVVRGGRRALWRTDDGGKSWQQIRTEMPEFAHGSYEFVHFRDRLHGMALLWAEVGGLHVERTADGGRTWVTDEKSWPYDSEVFLSIIHAGAEAHVYWGTEVLYKSGPLPADDETIRRLVSRRPTHPNLGHLRRRFYVVSQETLFVEEPIWWEWSGYECLLGTRDGGRTWQRKFLTAGFKNILFVDSRHGWAVGCGGRISRTRDGGDNWIHRFLPTDADLNAVYFLDTNVGWVGGGRTTPGCIWRTENGGATWKQSPPITSGRKGEHGIPETVHGLLFRDEDHGWAVTHGKTLELEPSDDWPNLEYGRILHTNDGGITWNPVYYGRPLAAIARRENVFLAVGYGTLRSEDGSTWQDLRSGYVLFGVTFADDSRAVAVADGIGSNCLVSNDAGESWQPSGPFADTHLACVGFGSATTGWVGGAFAPEENGGIFLTTDGGRSWQPCEVLGVRGVSRLSGRTYWCGLSAADASHAWAVSQMSIARLKPPDKAARLPAWSIAAAVLSLCLAITVGVRPQRAKPKPGDDSRG